MKADEAAKAAVNEVRKWMSRSNDPERETLETFYEAFAAEAEGWKMRMEELDEEYEQ